MLDGPVDANELKLFVMTFNLSGAKVTPESFSFVPRGLDMYVLGFQEVSAFVPVIAAKRQHNLTSALTGHFGPEFQIVCDESLLAIKLFIAAKPEIAARLVVKSVQHVSTGASGAYGNKGAVACSMVIDSVTPVLFVVAHFEAHERGVELRNENYATIMKALQGALGGNPITTHQFCFFVGDLNYRLAGTYEEVKRLAQAGKYNEMMDYDQLTKEKRAMRVFAGFQEEEIYFPPTYKFNKNSMTYDTSKKQRVPSFTDRILFCAKHRRLLECTSYESDMDVLISDHRPVFAHFTMSLLEATNIVARALGAVPKSRVCNVA